MRSSCNGCRALRKACADGCAIRPCLAWIAAPEGQANATVFLAKFYGRAGLLNLLAAAPDDAHRPALFRSLLYEACGRAAHPVYGAAGLFSSGNWEACKDALLAVLDGRPVAQVDARLAVPHPGLLLAHDIRHRHADAATKDKIDRAAPAPVAAPLLGVSRAGRASFKRASSSSLTARPKSRHNSSVEESAGSHGHVEDGGVAAEGEQTTTSSGSHVIQAEQSPPVPQHNEDDDEIGLELTLGLGSAARVVRSPPECFGAGSSSVAESGHMGLLLGLPV